MSEEKAPFSLGAVSINETSWGPTGVPERFAAVPFASFNRSDRIGKCADFGGFTRYTGRRYGRFGEENLELTYKYDAEEAREFNRVEKGGKIVTGAMAAPQRTGQRFGQNARGGKNAAPAAGAGGAGTKGYDDRSARAAGRTATRGGRDDRNAAKGGKGMPQKRMPMRRGPGGMAQREFSVNVTADWLLVESVELSQLTKLSVSAPPAGKDLAWAGSLAPYDEEFDRVTSRTARRIKATSDLDFLYHSAEDDSILQDIAQEEDSSKSGNVFITDSLLSHLMTCARSVYPWDIVVTYLPGGIIFLDAREPFKFEALTVNETAHQPPPEDEEEGINSRPRLTEEATFLDQMFTQQVLLPNSKPTDPAAAAVVGSQASDPKLGPNPYWKEDEAEEGHKPASLAYRYRRFDLPGDIQVIARTTVNAITRKRAAAFGSADSAASNLQYVSVATLNEWDAKAAGTASEWRKTVDSQRGALLASEIKNNSHRLAKATVSALLSGADSLRLGLVSRAARTDADNHVILGVHNVQPSTFASQVGVNMNNGWGIIRWLIETIRKHADNLRGEGESEEEYVAKFVLLKDPNKPLIYLYNVAPDAFDREDEADAEEAYGEAGAERAAGAAEGGDWAPEAPKAEAAAAAEDDEDDGAVAKKPGASTRK